MVEIANGLLNRYDVGTRRRRHLSKSITVLFPYPRDPMGSPRARALLKVIFPSAETRLVPIPLAIEDCDEHRADRCLSITELSTSQRQGTRLAHGSLIPYKSVMNE